MSSNGYRLVAPQMDDLEATVEMFNLCSLDSLGVRKFDVEDIRTEWKSPGLDILRDLRLVKTADGQVVGYYEVWDLNDPHTRISCWGRVHPQYQGQGIGTALLGWVKERAAMAIPKAPPEARVALLGYVPSQFQHARRLFEENGFTAIRRNLRMVIDLEDHPVTPPKWPQGITVRTMRVGQEERAVLEAVNDAFRDHWGHVEHSLDQDYERWMHFMNTSEYFDPQLWFLALDGDQIVGTSLCYPQTDGYPEMGWVGSLGVRRAWRRRGLAMALLHHSFEQFRQRGKRQVGLGVDGASLTGATDLYLKAGMRPEPQHEYTIYEMEMRPGVELSTQSI